MNHHSLSFVVGLSLLFGNFPVGWLGLFFCTYLARKMRKKLFYPLGTGLYVASWGMIVAGLLLAGPEGVSLIEHLSADYHLGKVCVAVTVIVVIVPLLLLLRKAKHEKNEIDTDAP